MAKVTLESLAKRVEALELALATKLTQPTPRKWRQVVGMFGDSDFMKTVDEEGRRIREAERKAARRVPRNER